MTASTKLPNGQTIRFSPGTGTVWVRLIGEDGEEIASVEEPVASFNTAIAVVVAQARVRGARG